MQWLRTHDDVTCCILLCFSYSKAVQRIPFLGEKTHTAAALRLLQTDVFQEQFGDRISVPNFAVIVTG